MLLTVHPDASNLDAKIASGRFVDRGSCRAYAELAAKRLEARIAKDGGRVP